MNTICLNMIVRQESLTIRRCLDSVIGFIDHWIIVDTGSTDGTQGIILDCLKDLPGHLYEKAWVDFAFNRNEALQLALNKGDYILFIDADEKLVSSGPFPPLNEDSYTIRMVGKSIEFTRDFLIKNSSDWRWVGAIHETLFHPKISTSSRFPGAYIEYNSVPGYRSSDPNTAFKDIQLLEQSKDSRSIFYLAQSYGRAGQPHLALEYYKKRAEMGGYSLAEREEVFWSLYNIGCLHHDLGHSFDLILQSFIRAFQYNQRAEPLYRLAEYFQNKNLPLLTYLIAQFALTLPTPLQTIRIQRWIYDYGLLQKFEEASHSLRDQKENL